MSLELIAEACKKLQDDKDPLPSVFRKATAGDLALPSRSLAFPVELKKRTRLLHEAGLHHLDASIPVEKDLGLPYNSSHGN